MILSSEKTTLSRKLIIWWVSLLVPIVLLLTSIRLLLTPGFINLFYRMPGFPADPYGFTLQDRLFWSRYAVDFLLNDQDIAYLGDLSFEDGSQVFNQRELQHMIDVKRVVASAMTGWKIMLVVLFISGLLCALTGVWPLFREGLWRGGWLTLFFIFAIILFVMVAFGVLFVAFHNIFFEPGTWTFLWTDTLIRLFPERFWRDIFICLGLMTAAFGAVTIYFSLGSKKHIDFRKY